MANSANSSATYTSGSQANVPHNSSSSPALSVETLTASIVGAFRLDAGKSATVSGIVSAIDFAYGFIQSAFGSL